MILQEHDLSACLSKAKEVAHHYKLTTLAADDPQRQVDHLLGICQQYLHIQRPKLVVLDVPAANSAVYSMSIFKQDGSFDIAIASGLNHCWTRYAVCKEVFHAILDAEEFRNMNIAEHVESVCVEFLIEDAKPSRSVASEYLTEIAAMEFLFPYAEREKEIARAGGTSLDYRGIAEKYRIPQVKIDKFLSNEFMRNLNQFKD